MKSRRRMTQALLGGGLIFLLVFTIASQAVAQTWIEITPPDNPLTPADDPPAVRSAHTGVFDPVTNQMIIFGGVSPHFNDVWRLGDANGIGIPAWAQATPAGTPPVPRFAHKANYDEFSDRMIVFGGGLGFSSPCSSQVWVLTDASGAGGPAGWTLLAPSGGPPAARFGHAQAHDPTTDSLIIYSGSNCFSAPSFNDVWVLSNATGLGGPPAWTQLSPVGAPPARVNAAAVYDAASNRMIVFGGSTFGGALLNDVWVLSNANGLGGPPSWTQLFPLGTPPDPRATHTGVYDPATDRLVIFGGFGIPTVFNDVWVLSNASGVGGPPSWTQLLPAGVPPAPRSATAVLDPTTNRMIVFGGSSPGGPLNDVWVLTDANGIPAVTDEDSDTDDDSDTDEDSDTDDDSETDEDSDK